MNAFQAIVLGFVQGVCEFLPVSSSGHLVLFQNIFGIQGDLIFFDTMLHAGTLIALCAVYAKTIFEALRHPFSKLSRYVILATIPLVVIALIFKALIEESFEGAMLGWGFLLTAGILLFAERVPGRYKRLEQMRPRDALVMGVMQGVAAFPGISRSGSTIAGGLIMGVERETSANLAFLMGGPAILGALALHSYDLIKEGGAHDVQWLPVILGTITAAVTGFFAIRFMIRFIQKHKLYAFAIYTAALGVLILLDQNLTHLVF